jgi:hypothetical protein
MESCVNSVKDYIKSFFDPLTAHIINEYLIICNKVSNNQKWSAGSSSIKLSFNLTSGIVQFRDKYTITIDINKKFGEMILEDKDFVFFDHILYLSRHNFEDFYNSFSIDEKCFTNTLHFVKNKEKNDFEETLLNAPKRTEKYLNTFHSRNKLIFLCRKTEYGPYYRYLIFNNRDCLKQFLIDCEHIMYIIKHYLLHEIDKGNMTYIYNRSYLEYNIHSIKNHDIDNFKLPKINDAVRSGFPDIE